MRDCTHSPLVCLALLSTVFVSGLSQPALALECSRQRARELAAAGIELAEQQRFVAALDEFEKALECQPHHDIYYNIAQVQMVLGRPVEAQQAIRDYLATAGDSLSAAERRAAREDMARLDAQIAFVTIEVEPPAARVLVDGRPLTGTAAGSPLALRTGPHVFTAEAEGYETSRVSASLYRGEQRIVNIRLVPAEQSTDPPRAGASVALSCSLPDVEVRVNRRRLGRTPLAPVVIAPGPLQVELSRPGYSSRRIARTARPGETVEIDCSLPPRQTLAEDERTRFEVVPSVAGAQVLVNGRLFRGGFLPAGKHYLQVSRPGYEPYAAVVRLPAGSIRRHVHLERQAWYAADLEAEAGSGFGTRETLSAALAAGGAGVGIAALVLWRVNHDRYENWERENDALFGQPPPQGIEARLSANNERARSIDRLSTVAGGLGIAAGALTLSSLALLLLPWSDEVEPDRAALWLDGVVTGPRDGTVSARVSW